MALKSGFYKTEITPPVGIDLTGYIAREGVSTGIHDPLYAASWIVASSDKKIVLISCDILAFSQTSIDFIRKKISEKTGIPEDHIILIATHTHSGPATIFLRNCGKIDNKWLNFFHNQVIKSAVKACEKLLPVKIYSGRNRVWLSYNRNDPEAGTDDTLKFLRIDSLEGNTVGFFIQYSCHPVVLDEKNLYISSDYPHYIRKYFYNHYGDKITVLFSSGACGDLDPQKRGSFQYADEFGKALASAIIKTKPDIIREDKIQFKKESFKVQFDRLPSLKETDELIELYYKNYRESVEKNRDKQTIKINRTFYEWAESIKKKIETGILIDNCLTEISSLALGDTAILFFPGEVFSEIANDIYSHSPYKETFFSGCSNGDAGYIGTEKAFEKGGYEIEDAHKYYDSLKFSRTAGDILVEKSLKMLNGLHNRKD